MGGVVASYLVKTYGWTTVFVASGMLAFASALGALIIKQLPKPVRPDLRISGSGPSQTAKIQ